MSTVQAVQEAERNLAKAKAAAAVAERAEWRERAKELRSQMKQAESDFIQAKQDFAKANFEVTEHRRSCEHIQQELRDLLRTHPDIEFADSDEQAAFQAVKAQLTASLEKARAAAREADVRKGIAYAKELEFGGQYARLRDAYAGAVVKSKGKTPQERLEGGIYAVS